MFFKHKGYGLLLPTVACAALIGGVGLGVTKMSNVSVGAILSTKTKYIGQQYALNTADKYCRLHNYASLSGFDKRKIDGSDDYYEEVVVTDATVPIVNGRTEMSSVASKDITVNVYHKEADEMPLVSSIKLYRTDPATFEPGFNMVANDATSTNEYQAMSANAFRELLKSKISDDMTADTGNVAMSANASKLYINSVLKNYALADDTVSVENDAGVGSPFRGVYIDQDGVAKPIDVIVRGNKSTDTDPLILVPEKKGSTWQFNTIRKSQLKGSEKTTFTITIKQTPNQTITVTTSDGVKHTESFDAKKGTTWTATVDGATGYNPGKLISTSGTVTGATTVSATEATIKQFDFNITQSEGQTITVTTGDGVKHTESFKAKYGTTWSATVTADEGNSAEMGQTLFNEGHYNNDKIYSVKIPNNVTQVRLSGHWGPHHLADGSQTYYVNNKEYENDYPTAKLTLVEVTPSSTINIKAYASTSGENESSFLDTWGVFVAERIVDNNKNYTAGNLIVNGTDTGSTTGSGTIKEKTEIKASAAINDNAVIVDDEFSIGWGDLTDQMWRIVTVNLGNDATTWLVTIKMCRDYIDDEPIGEILTDTFSFIASGKQKIYFNGGGTNPNDFDSIDKGEGNNEGVYQNAWITIIDKATGKEQTHTINNSSSHLMFYVYFTKQ